MIHFDIDNERWIIQNKTFTYQIGLKDGVCHHICFLPIGFAPDIDYELIMGRALQPEAEIQINNEPRSIHCGTRWIGCAASSRAVYTHHQIILGNAEQTLIITSLDEKTGLEIDNCYIVYEDSQLLTRYVVLRNTSDTAINIQHLGSFSVYGMPFFTDSTPGKDIVIHNFPSSWTWEGQHKATTAAEAGLYHKNSLGSWRVESTGSWSCKDYAPYFVIEQKSKKIFWSAQIEHSGSWRFEIGGGGFGVTPLYMQGGLGNQMYAHWSKLLAPGEGFQSITASLTCTSGGLDDVMNLSQEHRVARQIHRSQTDQLLPVIFNEWLSTGGGVREETINRHLQGLKNIGVDIYVLDAGWYQSYDENGKFGNWFTLAGDWEPHPSRFPDGIKAVADHIRNSGIIPGIWFEIEIAGEESEAFTGKTELFMRNETGLVETGSRRFLYFGDRRTCAYATDIFERFIESGFGYFKIDYNVDCGLGCINSGDSMGQGLLENIRGYYQWLDELRNRHPSVIFENCSSGGNRLDYGLLSRSELASITDQDDWFRLSSVFYGVCSYVHPSQMGTFSTVKEELNNRELVFAMINSMMGRMILSGKIDEISDEKKQIVLEAVSYYKRWREIITNSRLYHHTPYASLEEPEGWLVLQMCSRDSGKMLLGAWRLGNSPAEYTIRLKESDRDKDYLITEYPAAGARKISGCLMADSFTISLPEEFSAVILGFERME